MAVSLVCERLDGGRITAVDRSPKMIAMAQKRNRAHSGKTRFVTASIETADLGDETYDKVLAVHVAALQKRGPALDAVRNRLVPGGRLYLFSQAPGWKEAGQAADSGIEVGGRLEQAGFDVVDTLVEEVGSAFVVAVVAAR